MNPLARNLGLLTSACECAVLRRLTTVEARDKDTGTETCAPRMMLRLIWISVQHVHLLC
ncbi:hypothetical protein JMJ77_0012350, partial [Colletotrichum scovillei]